jgi:hypothetical protein
LDQVGPTSIKQSAEIEIERMSRKDIANELIRNVFLAEPRKVSTLKYVPEIPISLDQFRALDLKICLREFRLKKHVSELHINFGPLGCVAE